MSRIADANFPSSAIIDVFPQRDEDYQRSTVNRERVSLGHSPATVRTKLVMPLIHGMKRGRDLAGNVRNRESDARSSSKFRLNQIFALSETRYSPCRTAVGCETRTDSIEECETRQAAGGERSATRSRSDRSTGRAEASLPQASLRPR